ncbi:MAG: glycosyltransferase family 4 protein [Planctomycetales bacterium]|nr:glycosyltransferase family 4 protein [Planctomycetales bacterium]
MAVAFELLISGLAAAGIDASIVDTQWGGSVRNSGRFNLKRMFIVGVCVVHAWWKTLNCQTLYMPISTSRLGFIRDSMIIRFAALLKRRIVVHLHGSGLKPLYENSSERARKLMRQTLTHVDCYVVLGELLRDQFSFVPGWEDKTRVVLNGTPIDEKAIADLSQKSPPANGEPWRFLYLSNLMLTKGYLELVEACHILLQQGYSNFQCNLCGEFLGIVAENDSVSVEDRETEFLQRIKAPPLSDHVHYHGTVSGSQKDAFLREAHALVLPTYYPWEGQPLSINEALAWATPVVSTRHRGIPEQVLDGENGYFVEPGNAESLAACLKSFLDDKVPYEAFSRNARKHFENNFTNAQHLAKLIPLLVD